MKPRAKPGNTQRADMTAAVRALNNALDQARREWIKGRHSGRSGMITALAAACDFICAADRTCGLKYTSFHMVLIAALHDLNDGTVAPFLKPKNIGRGRRTGFARSQLQWHAAATMASLMELGRLREDVKISRPSAAKHVADVLTECGIHNATPRSVANCYDKHKQTWHGFYVAGTHSLLIDGIRRRLPGPRIRELLLNNLTSIARVWQAPNSS
jgi:hypothetical protein